MNIWSRHIARLLVVALGGKHGRGHRVVGSAEAGMEGGGRQWQRQRPILRLAAGSSVNESRAGHVWVGRRDSPAAETDATVVRLNFFCQAPPSTGQKQTQMLVANACVCILVSVCVNREKEYCLIWYQALPGARTSRAVIVYCSVPSTFHLLLCSPSLFLSPISISHHPSSQLFLVCHSLSLSIFTPAFPLHQSWFPLQWKEKRQREGGGRQDTESKKEVRDIEGAVWYLVFLFHTLCYAFCLLSPPLTILHRAGLESVRVGARQQPVPRPVRHVLPLYLHINSSIDHVLLNMRKRRAGKSEKHQTEFITKHHCNSGNKNAADAHGHIPLSSQGRTHHAYTPTVYEDKPSSHPTLLTNAHCDTHTTTTAFIFHLQHSMSLDADP